MVQNRTNYIKTALEHLNDPVTYMVLDGDRTSQLSVLALTAYLKTFIIKDY